MKKKLSIILLLLTISLCSIVSIDRVWGVPTITDNYNPGTTSVISECENNFMCYSGSVGFRITIVDKTTGKRCKFKTITENGKTTYDLCSIGGEDTKSKDYWFKQNDIDEIINSGITCRAYSTKYTKAEHLVNNDYSSNIGACSDNYTEYYQLNNLFSDYNMYDKDYGFKNYRSDTDIENSKQPKNMERVKNWFEYRQDNGSTKELAAIFKSVTGKNITAEDVLNHRVKNMENISIQFEQLLLVVNYHKSGSTDGYAALGTVAEASYLYANDTVSISTGGATLKDEKTPAYRWCTIQNLDTDLQKNNAANSFSCDSNMFSGGYWTGWSNSKAIGSDDYIKLSEKTHSVAVVSNITNYLDGKYTKTSTYDFDFKKFYNEASTANLYNVLIDDDLISSCHDEAYEYLDKELSLSSNSYYLNETQNEMSVDEVFCEKNASNKYDYPKVQAACCNGNVIDASKCPQLTSGFLSKVGVLVTEERSDNNDLCATYTCAEMIGTEDVDGKINDLVSSGKLGDIYAEGSLYSRIIGYFAGIYNNDTSTEQAGLKEEVWRVFFKSKAICGRTIPNCKPETGTASCNTDSTSTNSFTIKDSENISLCILEHYAYNDGNAGTLQSSKDDEYSSGDYEVFCQEEVSFNFPSGNRTAVAGTVFKWGIYNNGINDDVFGTMTVKRKCYLPGAKAMTYTSNWANVGTTNGAKINPTITINYKQPLKDQNLDIDYKEFSENLSVYLYKFESHAVNDKGTPDDFSNDVIGFADYNFIVYNRDGTIDKETAYGAPISAAYNNSTGHFSYIDYEENGYKLNDEGNYIKGNSPANNPRTITCNTADNCANVDYIEMIATYNIVYNNKFTWYADKSNNGELELNDPNATEVDSSFVFAGYGMPVSFAIGDNIDCNYIYGYQGSGATGSSKQVGNLDVIVSNVGTYQGGENYHFDKLIENKSLFTDDSTDDNDFIDYYCDFQVSNPLFDYEYGPKSDFKCELRTPKGIDVVFRTVDLISSADQVGDAFPGRSGLGERAKGANWAKYDNEQIAQILSDKVYQQDPMYYIKLDSPTIQMIREWNNAAREQGIDPYTYMGEPKTRVKEDPGYGYTGYIIDDESVKVNNEDITYKFVQSRFLTMLSNRLEDDHYLSICVNGDTHILNCNQSWWKEETDDKNTITINITEKSIEE